MFHREMTPFKLRFEIFKHATYLKEQEFEARMEDYRNKYSNLRDIDNNPVCPTYPSFSEIVALAESISNFVE